MRSSEYGFAFKQNLNQLLNIKTQICYTPFSTLLNTDFRPVSVTPVLARLMEKVVVRELIYPALLSPPPDLTFADQFAFQPSGSTTACSTRIFTVYYAQ